MKKVLIICNENSCRSIMAEAVLNYFFNDKIEAYSCGINKDTDIDPDALKAIKEFGVIITSYLRPKPIEEVFHVDFDLVITVCDNVKESCPIFPKKVKTIHVDFEDPTGKKYFNYLKVINEMKETLPPIIERELEDTLEVV